MRQHPVDHPPRRPGLDHPVKSLLNRAAGWRFSLRHRIVDRLPKAGEDRGDVPGWVLVTLMTAGLVVTLWAVAGPRLEEVFNDAMDRVVGGP